MIKKFIDKLLSKADSVRPRKPRFGKRVEVPASVHGIDPTLVDRRALPTYPRDALRRAARTANGLSPPAAGVR